MQVNPKLVSTQFNRIIQILKIERWVRRDLSVPESGYSSLIFFVPAEVVTESWFPFRGLKR